MARTDETLMRAPRSDAAEPERLGRSSGAGRARLLLHLLTLACTGAFLLYANRDQWFFADDWDFLLRRGLTGAELSLWQPHNEHWVTVPILAWRGLIALFGFSYPPYVVALVVAVLAAAHLSWRLAAAAGADPRIASAVVLISATHAVAQQDLLFAFQLGFTGSLLFGSAQMLLALRTSRVALLLSWACGIMAVASSGVGPALTAGASVAALVRGGPKRAVLTGAVPAVAFVCWYLLLGRLAGRQAPPPSATEFVAFVGHAVVLPWTQLLGLSLGALVLLFLVVGAARSLVTKPRCRAVFVGCLAAWAFQVLLAGYGRASLGADQAGASRYLHVSLFMLAPVVAVSLTTLAADLACSTGRARVDRAGPWFVAGLVLAGVLIPGGKGLLQRAEAKEAEEAPWQRQVRAAASWLSEAPRPLLRQQVEPRFNPDVFAEPLVSAVRAGQLDTAPASQDPEAVLSARGVLQSRVDPLEGASAPGTATPATASSGLLFTGQDEPTCFRVVAEGRPGQLQLPAAALDVEVAGPPGLWALYLSDPSSGSTSLRPHEWSLGSFHLQVRAEQVLATLQFPLDWTGRVCGLRAS